MTYRVLLVDDEEFDLAWLKKSIPWDDLNLVVAGAVHSGFEALSFLEKDQVDILLSDISMPIMSGLEMVNKVKESYSNIKVIFISGYEDFSYAQQAIGLGAYGYVLKPFKNNEVIQLLERAVNNLNEERNRDQQSSIYKHTLNLVKGAVIHEWLIGNTNVNDGATLLQSYGISLKRNVNIAVIEIDDLNKMLSEFPKDEHEQLTISYLKEVNDLLVEKGIGYSFVYQNKIILLVDQYDKESSKYKLKELIKDIQTLSMFTVTIGIGDGGTDICVMPTVYKQALNTLAYKMFFGKSRIIEPCDVSGIVKAQSINLDESLDTLFTCVLNYDLVGIDDHIEEIFNQVDTSLQKISVYNLTLFLVSQLDK